MNCPDDAQPLTDSAEGAWGCRRCGGALFEPHALERHAPGLAGRLVVEDRPDCGAFLRGRACPRCATAMAPHRLGRLEAWLERCASCELWWADKTDLRATKALAGQAARAAAVATLTPGERRELARELAAATASDVEPAVSPVKLALGFFGVPALLGTDDTRDPWLTWGLAASLVGVHLLGLALPAVFGPGALGYDTLSGGVFAAFTSTFAHAGWWHLLGNVGFLLAFGDGLEQKLSRLGYGLLFAAAGTLAALAQGLAGTRHELVLGASGAISTLMGACVVLQPGARVFFLVLGRLPLRVPIVLFGALELGWQLLMSAFGTSDVAWVAHVSGLVLGLAVGLAVRRGRAEVARTPAPAVACARPEKASAAPPSPRSPWS